MRLPIFVALAVVSSTRSQQPNPWYGNYTIPPDASMKKKKKSKHICFSSNYSSKAMMRKP